MSEDMTVDAVLDFWFAEDHGQDIEAWKKQAMCWFRGGMDEGIIGRFGATLSAAKRGELDHWATTARGRLALILVSDQFPRSIHAGTADAFAMDARALELCLEGLENGHFEEITNPWQKVFFTLPLGHAEGDDHLARIDRAIAIADEIYETSDPALRPIWDFNRNQPRRARSVIEAFGRHPHRNEVLGRTSTPEEQAYLDVGEFPHSSAPDGSIFST